MPDYLKAVLFGYIGECADLASDGKILEIWIDRNIERGCLIDGACDLGNQHRARWFYFLGHQIFPV